MAICLSSLDTRWTVTIPGVVWRVLILTLQEAPMKNAVVTCIEHLKRRFGASEGRDKIRSEAKRTFSGASRCVWKMDSEA